jgi:EAL domain-containing protein (putative c-di-GMP-specific phosphodiesterase class I)
VEELDRVCREVSLLSATGLPPSASLFLNVATAALESPSFRVRDLLEAIAHAGIEPRRVVLEITEQERSTGSEQLAANLAACRQVGLRTALDDLGTGGSDLELLAKIPFDFVKVDMSFVQGAHELTRRRVLRGLGLLVAETGATAIAEGVETAADLALVRELGFAAAQGFLFGEPASHFHHPSPREVLTAC